MALNSLMHKALFLDRDGVVNREMGDYVFTRDRFHFEPGILDIARRAHLSGYLLIVITNQGGIQKGLYSVEQADALHAYLASCFEEWGCPLTDIYFSPYHPTISQNILSKPSSLMIEKACAKYQIDAGQSWMIGDRARDIVSGKRAGCHTVGIGAETQEAFPDFFAPSVLDLSRSEWMSRLGK